MIPKVCFTFVRRRNLNQTASAVNYLLKVFIVISLRTICVRADFSLKGSWQNLLKQARPVNNLFNFFFNDLRDLTRLRTLSAARNRKLYNHRLNVNRFMNGQSKKIPGSAVAFSRCRPEKEVLCKSLQTVNSFLNYYGYLTKIATAKSC